MYAAYDGNIAAVRMILEAGARPDKKDHVRAQEPADRPLAARRALRCQLLRRSSCSAGAAAVPEAPLRRLSFCIFFSLPPLPDQQGETAFSLALSSTHGDKPHRHVAALLLAYGGLAAVPPAWGPPSADILRSACTIAADRWAALQVLITPPPPPPPPF